MDPVTIATIGAVVNMLPAVIASATSAFQLYDEIQGDPEAKFEALKQLNEESKSQHEEAMAKLRECQREYEAASLKREKESDERLKILREEHQKNREILSAAIKKQDEKHDNEVKIMNDDHLKRIQEMRMETKEQKDKVEIEHRSKMEVIENEFKTQKRMAEEKLSIAKKEGDMKIADAEKEKKDLNEKRNEELQTFLEIAKKLNAVHEENVQKIRQKNRQFREENMSLRREQIQKENTTKLDHMNQICSTLQKTLDSENSRNVIEKLKHIAKPVISVQTSLEHIQHDCLPSHGGAPIIVPGRLDEDFRCITIGISDFGYHKDAFRRYVLNTNRTDQNLLNMCNALIYKMDEHMRAHELSELSSQLPLTLRKEFLGSEDLRVIKFYAEKSESLNQKFLELCGTMDREVQNIHMIHLPTASESTNRAIGQ